MLTRTLKFESDVLDVLRAMEWREGGTVGTIITQLDRKLYERTNKALETMGGKWNRKVGGHVFASDPRPQVEGLVASGALTVERDGFFETPKPVIDRMLELADLQPGQYVLEPSAGLGAIVRHLWDKYPAAVYMIEKNPTRAKYLKDCYPSAPGAIIWCDDFLTREIEPGFDRIVMNPPFEELQDVDHVRRAYDLLSKQGLLVSVMSESPFFRTDKKVVAFREWLEEVGGDSYELPEGSFKESGTGVCARLVVIRK